MTTKLYPHPGKVTSKWTRFEGEFKTESRAGEPTFLYIGTDSEFLFHFRSIFHAGIVTHSLLECQEVFDELPRNQYPQVIFIDLALDKKALKHFQNFLNQKKAFSRLVIIYNEKLLTQSNINYLKENELVDDVVNLNTTIDSLAKKINFLKKVKSSSPKQNYRISSEKVANVISRQKRTIHLKRLIDIIFAFIFLVFLIPLFVLIAVAIRIDSRGPIVYSSLRAGRGFKIFRFYKFRSMVVDADKKIEEYAHLNQYCRGEEGNAKFIKIANDPRITRLGKILRNCSLDELPQLINVLKGDMSLVGNRPLPLYEASTLTTNDHVERFMAPAGITGLWQIKKRGKAEMSTEERINLDISYARRYNIVYDLWIVARTPAALFQKSNA
ncbi:sugar transferase [Flavitalea sp.]|nr:sugar transferase [Flavitalea sp.]